jgi:hypothetical protein
MRSKYRRPYSISFYKISKILLTKCLEFFKFPGMTQTSLEKFQKWLKNKKNISKLHSGNVSAGR